jgi:hypothetical protein
VGLVRGLQRSKDQREQEAWSQRQRKMRSVNSEYSVCCGSTLRDVTYYKSEVDGNQVRSCTAESKLSFPMLLDRHDAMDFGPVRRQRCQRHGSITFPSREKFPWMMVGNLRAGECDDDVCDEEVGRLSRCSVAWSFGRALARWCRCCQSPFTSESCSRIAGTILACFKLVGRDGRRYLAVDLPVSR